MSDSLSFVAEVNRYLDSVDEQGTLDEGRMARLEEYKAGMLERGFNAPFLAMLAQTRAEMEEEAAADAQDRSRQLKRLRYIASLKRFTFNRLRVALATHKLAGALRESGQGALIPCLPLGGSYVKALSNAGEMAAEAYHYLMGLFLPRRFSIAGASALIKAAAGEKTEEKEVDLGESENPSEDLRALLGKTKGVKEVAIAQKPKGLIRNHSTRVALFTAASIAAEKEAREIMKEEMEKDAGPQTGANADAGRRLKDYNALLHKNNIVPDVPLPALEGMEKLAEEAVAGGFARRVHGQIVMDEELELALHKRRARYRHLCIEGAGRRVFGLLVWYYVCLHAQGRKDYGSMPAVLAEPDEKLLHMLHELQPAGDPLKHPDRLLMQKLQLEGRAPPLPSRAWGPAFIALKTGQDAAWAAKYFAADEAAISQAIPIVKSLLARPGGRGAKFLQELKKT